MPQNKIYKFRDIIEAQNFLNGGVTAGMSVPGSAITHYAGLVGKTLIVNGTTVTFTAGGGYLADPQLLTVADIKSQVETAASTVRVFMMNGQLCIIEKSPTSGITITHTGTANAILGFSAGADTVGKVYNPPGSDVGTPPVYVWANIGLDNSHVIHTWE